MTNLPPDDVPRSPTGRVPDWVLREASGEIAEPLPFRAPTGRERRKRRRSRTRAAKVQRTPRARRPGAVYPSVLVVALLGALYAYLVWNPLDVTFPWAVPGAVGSTPAALPPAGYEEGPRPPDLPPTPPAPPVSTTYGFISTQQDGVTPVLWSPCRPVHWVVRPEQMPVGAQTLLTEALDEVSRLSGLRFVYDGETDGGPVEDRTWYQPDHYGDRWAPVLIVWTSPKEVPAFGDDVVADALPYMVRTSSGDSAIVSGEVRLDSVKLNEAIIHKRIDLVHSVLLHELGHLVGLQHVSDTQQLMYPEAQLTLTELGRGDIAGLGFAGQGACQPDI